ncbi:hypothetical protein ACP70R_045145 [Stipagrostis hirtigluma subsp. patula]
MEALQWIVSAGININEETQLADELSHLLASLPKARFLINRSEWGMLKNKELSELLSHLKDTTYDAEDLLRKLDDQVLQQKIEDGGGSWAGQLLSSSLNLVKKIIYRSKKRVREIQGRLDKYVAEIEGVLNFMGLNVEPMRLMPETSSLISAAEVFGRDSEQNTVMDMLGVTIERKDEHDQVMKQLGVPLTRDSRSVRSNGKRASAADSGAASTSKSVKQRKSNSGSRARRAETNCSIDNVSVVPIVGIGGVGKTTLAQLIYNDSRVKQHFSLRVWVCVSDFFDKKKMTKEIIESIPEAESKDNLNALQEELRKQMECQKFLLVLDDIWPIATHNWEDFYARMRRGLKGSVILVTTRHPKVADLVTTENCMPVQLGGLPVDVFWKFFLKCAFGAKDPESYPGLHVIGKSISSRLCGSPLAAKTVGRLLSMNLTKEHWTSIQNSELWELAHQENEILPALQLSYLYLPQEIRRCFAFCSMFPKDYSFERHVLVNIWVAEGFVATGGSMRLEDVGTRYLDDLRSRFLFQTDPKFPDQTRYVMHDLIHDMAQSVSMDECFFMQDLSYPYQRRMPHTVRHMSVEGDKSFIRMIDTQYLNKLHSLRLTSFHAEFTWFNQLSNIRFLSLKGCRWVKLPKSICQLNSLRYLDISDSGVQELPIKFWCLYRLEVLDARHSGLTKIPHDVTKLISLRHLALPAEGSYNLSMVKGLGNLSFLRNLGEFRVGEENGRRIGELKGMNHVSETLSIKCLYNVHSKEEAAEARLADKQYLKELHLYWEEHCGSRENEVLEGLHPHSRIECLKIHGFSGDRFPPSWFESKNLPTLRSLELSTCRNLESVSIPYLASLEELVLNWVGNKVLTAGDYSTQQANSSNCCSKGIAYFAFTRLTVIRLYSCYELNNLDQFLSPGNLPAVKSIAIVECGLVSIPAHSFVGLTCLQDLKIHDCYKLVCPRQMVLPPSVRRLSLVDCGELDKSLPDCLENLNSLTLLQLVKCRNVKFIPLDSITRTNMLKCLVLSGCWGLSSIGGPHCLSSIQHVEIFVCSMLTEVEQPLEKMGLQANDDEELLKFMRYEG